MEFERGGILILFQNHAVGPLMLPQFRTEFRAEERGSPRGNSTVQHPVVLPEWSTHRGWKNNLYRASGTSWDPGNVEGKKYQLRSSRSVTTVKKPKTRSFLNFCNNQIRRSGLTIFFYNLQNAFKKILNVEKLQEEKTQIHSFSVIRKATAQTGWNTIGSRTNLSLLYQRRDIGTQKNSRFHKLICLIRFGER